MKKQYKIPEAEINCFTVQDVMNASQPGENETEIDEFTFWNQN